MSLNTELTNTIRSIEMIAEIHTACATEPLGANHQTTIGLSAGTVNGTSNATEYRKACLGAKSHAARVSLLAKTIQLLLENHIDPQVRITLNDKAVMGGTEAIANLLATYHDENPTVSSTPVVCAGSDCAYVHLNTTSTTSTTSAATVLETKAALVGRELEDHDEFDFAGSLCMQLSQDASCEIGRELARASTAVNARNIFSDIKHDISAVFTVPNAKKAFQVVSVVDPLINRPV